MRLRRARLVVDANLMVGESGGGGKQEDCASPVPYKLFQYHLDCGGDLIQWPHGGTLLGITLKNDVVPSGESRPLNLRS